MTDRLVIIGGVACGPKAAARARRRNPNVEIVIIERGGHVSYAGCGLPYYVGGTIGELEHLWGTQFGLARDVSYFDLVKGIDVRLHTEAIGIDRENKRVQLRNVETDERSELEYGQLVLATGGTPLRPPIEGLDLERVFSLHVPEDAARMRELIEADEVEQAVIVGGGSIGLEAAESLFAHAVDINVVEQKAHLLPALLDADMAALVADELRKNEVEIFTSENVVRIEGDANGTVQKVVTDKREIETDMVLVAAGVRPNVDLARQAGLQIGETGGIAVDENLRTSDRVFFAGGDCVECHDRITGEKICVPLGSTANKHGRVIGDNLAGGEERFPGIIGTAILKSLGLNIARTGLTFTKAKELGFDAIATQTPSLDRAHYYPGGKFIFVSLVADRNTQKLLGAQIVGAGVVSKRIDVVATALTFGATLKDISDLDLSYAPPFSTAVDSVAHAANHTRNQIDGVAKAIDSEELERMLASGAEFIVLDVRQPNEVALNKIDDPHVQCVPLTELRKHKFDISPDMEIVVLCQSGMRGYEGYRTLESMGFSRAKFLQGGIKAWVRTTP